MTRTYAILDVPQAVYDAVRALLKTAGYSHSFHADSDGEVIDMHGIALRSMAKKNKPKGVTFVLRPTRGRGGIRHGGKAERMPNRD